MNIGLVFTCYVNIGLVCWLQYQWQILGGGGGGGAKGWRKPPIIFTEALVLKSGSTRKFSFQEVEPLLII